MTDTTSNNSKPKSNRKKIITLSTIGLFVITIALAFGLPFLATDGTEKFSGKELQVAKQAIGDGSYEEINTDPIPDLAIGFRAKIVEVYKNEAKKEGCGQDGQGQYYVIGMDKISFFGIERPGYITYGCFYVNDN